MPTPLTSFAAGSIPLNPGRFVQVPLTVLSDDRLSTGAKLFCANLLRWDWGGGCWLTERQLACELNVTDRTVRNHTKALEEAGHLWVFEDREGMTVRLVVRPGHVYPKPKWMGKSLFDMKVKSSWKNFSKPEAPYNELKEIEVHELPTTGLEVDLSSSLPTCEPVRPVVCASEPLIHEETPIEALEIDPEPEELHTPAVIQETEPTPEAQTLNVNSLSPTWIPPGVEVPELHVPCEVPAALSLADELAEIGVSRLVAEDLAENVPPEHVRAALRYMSGYRGEVLNPPGLVRHLLETAAKLPRWCYPAESDERKRPTETRSEPDPDFDPPSGVERERRRALSPHAALWEKVCGRLEGMMKRQSFKTWFVPAFIDGIDGEVVTLNVPSEFFAGWIEEHYTETIVDALRAEGVNVERVECLSAVPTAQA